MIDTFPNPYVGPRSIQRGESFYGRAWEQRRLANLLIAERIVLLHAPSGAGKSSLIQAALIPALEANGRFEILPTMRVSRLPATVSTVPASTNRYIFSLLLSLEDAFPEDEQWPESELAELDLEAYLQARWPKSAVGKGQLLIFDQFEEIITHDPYDRGAKEQFFVQVGSVLSDRDRWALFIVRDSHVAALEPYLYLIPTHLRTSFRLDLLDHESALSAIRRPTEEVGVVFEEEAARALLRDLSMVQVQQPDGTAVTQEGPFVEPVHLQVVCSRLWERIKAADRLKDGIGTDDLADLGDVSNALASYYRESVAKIAADLKVSEHHVRGWIGTELITEQGMRGQVLQEPSKSRGLPNEVIASLVDAHLVRKEERRGRIWYELAHDRLLEPIVTDNERWRGRRQARNWTIILAGVLLAVGLVAVYSFVALLGANNELTHAQSVVADIQSTGTVERSTAVSQATAVATSEALAATSEALASEAIATRMEAEAGATAAATEHAQQLEAVAATATSAQGAAEQAAASAESRRLASVALQNLHLGNDVQLGVLLSVEALRSATTCAAYESLAQALELLKPATQTELYRYARRVTALDLNNNTNWLAAGHEDGTIYLWNLRDAAASTPIEAEDSAISTLAFDRTGHLLAISSETGAVTVWRLEEDRGQWQPVRRIEQNNATRLAFDLNGPLVRLVTIDGDGTILRWPLAFEGETSGTPTATPDAERADLEQAERIDLPSFDSQGIVAVALSADAAFVAIAYNNGAIRVWNVSDTGSLQPQIVTGGRITAFGLSRDGRFLAAGRDDGTIQRWDVATGEERLPRLPVNDSAIVSLRFDVQRMLIGSGDGAVHLWDINKNIVLPFQHEIGVAADVVALSAETTLLAAGDANGALHLWRVPRCQEGDQQPLSEAALNRMLDEACASVGRNMSQEEWSLYFGDVLYESTCPTLPEHPSVGQQAFGPEELIIGQSAQGTPIEVVRLGTGSASVLFIGGLHAGFAPGSVELAERAIEYFSENPEAIPESVTLYVVVSANPDSLLAPGTLPGRLNANGVDLNRNWDCDWTANARFRNEVIPGSGGAAPFSEPETQALRDFIASIDPVAVVFWEARASGGLVSPGSCGVRSQVSQPLAQIYGRAAGYHIADFEAVAGQELQGDGTNWLDDQGVPAISVLLPDYTAIDWENSLAGIQAVLDQFSEGNGE